MFQPVATRSVVVANRTGLHARAAVLIATAVRRYDATVEIVKGLSRVDAREVLQLLSLGADHGERLSVEAAGNDAEQALEAVEQLFIRKFDEE